MNECSNELQLKHAEAIATLQSEMGTVKIAVSDFKTIKDTLVELKLLYKQEMEFRKEQKQANSDFKEALSNINDNLIKLNSRVETVETKEETKTEKFKSKYLFYGVIGSSALSLVGIIITLIIKR